MLGAVTFSMSAGVALPWAPYLTGAVGLVLLHERLRRQASVPAASIAALLTYGGTSLFWSMTSDGGLIDAAIFSWVAAALVAEIRWPLATRAGTLVWVGLVAGPLALRTLLPRAPTPVSWDGLWFSSTSGVLALTPVVYLSLAGTISQARHDRARTLVTLLVVGVWTAAAALVPVEGPGGRFGHGLTAALALLAPGLADLIEQVRRRPWPAVVVAVTAALVWNYWLMVQYTVGLLPKDAPVSFAAMVRQQADVFTQPPYWYPFAFPANVWFAWREGLPVDRYELLASEPRHAALDMPMNREAARFLLDGWEAAADADDAQTWTRDRRATLAARLALPEGRPIDVVIAARARLDDPPVNAMVGIEINGREVGRVTVPPTAVTELRVSVSAEVGAVFRAGYNRLAFVSHGVTRVDPSDQRPPGLVARRIGDRPWPVAVHRVQIGVREP